MTKPLILCAGKTQAARYALTYLQELGLPVTDTPSMEARHLILDVPSFESSGQLRLGGSLDELLSQLPHDITIYGGNLANHIHERYRTVDFLQCEDYLAQNAYLTAESALDVALPYMTITLRNCPILIIGWGRIGKCLGRLLKNLEADVTIAARNPAHRAMISALGYHALDTAGITESLNRFRLIFNTVPSPVLSGDQIRLCRDDCVRIELASVNGMDDPDAIIARGLPGIHLPESSGKLIAETFLTYYQEESL